ncbi:hypothetical protein L3Q82_008849 [Scortum barcoo]|uniref:Uncharacterized protein n=1 Tax=Scortum barcoo TaxID=214431 RepID=A0ACB8XD71_9TELE|nr:hypothetical protein L3Q82_008849 [Scortum barcoo]
MQLARVLFQGLGRRGPPPRLLTQTTLHQAPHGPSCGVVSLLEGGPTSSPFRAEARPGPVGKDPATRRSPASPCPRPGSRVGPLGDHTSQPPRKGLRQGTGEENSAYSRPSGFRRNNAVFVPVVEHWTSSIPSTGCLEGLWEFAQPVHMCFVDLEKAFDRVPRGILWGVLREYGVRGPLLRAVRSLYDRSRSLVRIAGSKSDLFPVHVGLRQGCPLSPVLFIIFMDRISRRSQGPEGVRFGNHRISSLLFADDVSLNTGNS